MNIYEKLQKARVELQNKNLKKSGKNGFNKFGYFELSDFLPAVNEIFLNLLLFPHFNINRDVATLSILDIEKSEDVLIFQMPVGKLKLSGGCNEIQELGGINTYCRRYLYLNALEIVENDKFDAEAGKKEETKPAKKSAADEIFDPDIDIITGLTGVADIKNLEIYYRENKDKVKDVKAFNVAVNRRKEVILEGNKNE